MHKKQLLKLGHGKKGRVMKAAALSLMIVGMCAGGVVTAGNVKDKPYNEYSTNGASTKPEKKEDATSAYILHSGYADVNVQVRNGGNNYSAGGATFFVKMGQSRYLPNYIYELGMRECYLWMRQSATSAGWLYGVWSPDSV